MPNTCYSAELLAKGGIFDRQWSSFSSRSGQQQMASLVEQAITEPLSMVIEAASGSGKTLAYLVPIISQNKRAVISTASRYLQYQLFNHDIPLAKNILQANTSVALLQGRSHYLCPYNLEKNIASQPPLGKHSLAQLRLIDQRYRETGHGELDKLAPNITAGLRVLVTSGADNCLSVQCPKWVDCPLVKARQYAHQADIVVVNHSLLFVDQMMKQQHFAELLPNAEVVVVDEAHRLTDFAQTLVGDRLSSKQLRMFVADITAVIKRFAREQTQLLSAIEQLELGLSTLAIRLPLMKDSQPAQFVAIVDQLVASLGQLFKHLEQLQTRHYRLAEMTIRTQWLITLLGKIASQRELCWIQSITDGFIIHAVPVELATYIKPLMNTDKCSWVFTSATLSVSNKPHRFLASLGLDDMPFHRLNSDIDYQLQAKFFTPLLPVNPDHTEYSQYLLEEVIALLNRVSGRVLFLFSSFRALAIAAEQLKNSIDRPILEHCAGNEADNNHYQLIKSFKQHEQSVLMATGSFWEGVDLSGLPISAVIIDKLPFAMPADPLVQFRSRELSRHGIDSFEQYVLPEAVIRVRQGCGRLLRRISDRGVIMLADPRLHSRAYGQVFIDSLPAMEQVYSIAQLQPFFNVNSYEEPKQAILNENTST